MTTTIPTDPKEKTAMRIKQRQDLIARMKGMKSRLESVKEVALQNLKKVEADITALDTAITKMENDDGSLVAVHIPSGLDSSLRSAGSEQPGKSGQ